MSTRARARSASFAQPVVFALKPGRWVEFMAGDFEGNMPRPYSYQTLSADRPGNEKLLQLDLDRTLC